MTAATLYRGVHVLPPHGILGVWKRSSHGILLLPLAPNH